MLYPIELWVQMDYLPMLRRNLLPVPDLKYLSLARASVSDENVS